VELGRVHLRFLHLARHDGRRGAPLGWLPAAGRVRPRRRLTTARRARMPDEESRLQCGAVLAEYLRTQRLDTLVQWWGRWQGAEWERVRGMPSGMGLEVRRLL
jgi:hypothetical protein